MTGSPSNQDIFDVRKIRRLVELMNEHDLSEMDLRQGDTRIRIRRGSEPVVVRGAGQAAALPAVVSPASTESGAGQAVAPSVVPAKAEEHIVFVKSPMVGTFYAAPDPDSPPYVKVGDHVGPETIVCIVEAMKVFNEIPAEVSGKVVSVLVDNGEPVEYGQPLFKVDTSQ